MNRTIRHLLLFFVLCAVPAQTAHGVESYSFLWQGVWFAGSPAYAPDGSMVDSSFNFVPNPYDRTISKRWGTVEDTVLVGADSTYNLIAATDRTIYAPYERQALVQAGSRWFVRHLSGPAAGEWDEITPPVGLNVAPRGRLQWAFMNGRVIVGGDSLSAFAQWDGEHLRRLKLPPEYNATKLGLTASAGGTTLSDSTWYHLALTYSSPYAGVLGAEEESWRSDTSMVYTTASNRQITVTINNPFPYWLSGGADTAGVSKINVYRGSTTEALRWIMSVEPTTTSFIDTGYTATLRAAPGQRREMTAGSWPVFHDDFLKYRGWGRLSPSNWVASEGAYSGLTDEVMAISPTGHPQHLVKHRAADVNVVSAFTDNGNGTFLYTNTSADFSTAGIVPGDYFSAKAKQFNDHDLVMFTHHFGQVTSVLSSDSLVVRAITSMPDSAIYYSQGGGGLDTLDTVTLTIGNNIIKAADEFMAVWQDSIQWLGEDIWFTVRGLFGSSPAGADTGALIYRVRNDGADQAVYYTAAGDPLRTYNYHRPYEIDPGVGGDITALFPLRDGLGVGKERSLHVLKGVREPFIREVLTRRLGVTSGASLAGDEDGYLFLHESDVYLATSAGIRGPYTESLGTAIRDSAAAGYHREAAGVIYDGNYWLSVPAAEGDFPCDVYVGDLEREDLWWRLSGGPLKPRVWGVWRGSNGVDSLWFGSWDDGGFYRMDRSASSDTGAAIEARAVTKTFRPGVYALFNRIEVEVDNNDTLFAATYVDRGDTVIVDTLYAGSDSTIHAGLSPFYGDTTRAAGSFRTWGWTVNERGAAMWIDFWTTGTGRCTLGRVTVWWEPKRRGR